MKAVNGRVAEKRRTGALGKNLESRFKAYGAAAGVAGVGLLALAQPVKADIVYTPADITFRTSSVLYLDLNHDGTNDFQFKNVADEGLGSTTFLSVRGVHAGNKIEGRNRFASALPLGAKIGPSGVFYRSDSIAEAYHGTGATWGRNRYLGLEFMITGQEHFGWAELSVGINGFGTITAKLEGYAYDTVANQPLLAGETSGNALFEGTTPPPTSATPEPGTLGLLALGSLGLGFWRRRRIASN